MGGHFVQRPEAILPAPLSRLSIDCDGVAGLARARHDGLWDWSPDATKIATRNTVGQLRAFTIATKTWGISRDRRVSAVASG
jgi:hypothetical protein